MLNRGDEVAVVGHRYPEQKYPVDCSGNIEDTDGAEQNCGIEMAGFSLPAKLELSQTTFFIPMRAASSDLINMRAAAAARTVNKATQHRFSIGFD